MLKTYDGNGYEFSIRLPNYKRLFIHVTRAALKVLNEGRSPVDQLGVLVKHMPLLHQLACQRHKKNGGTRVVIESADIKI
jgi:hypothetical protein